MFDLDRWQEIWAAIVTNPVRSILTAFGVFWGIFMLVVLVGAGNGLDKGVNQGFEDFATNSAFVWTQNTSLPYKGFKKGRNWHFTNSDMETIRQNIEEVELLAPRVHGWTPGEGGANAVRGKEAGSFNIRGDYPDYNEIDPNDFIYGRYINDLDIKEVRKVAVLGTRVYETLFPEQENPVGEYIKINGVYFKVIGVVESHNPNINFGGNKMETIHMPFTTLQKVYNIGEQVHYFGVTAKEGVSVSALTDKIFTLLKKRHTIAPEDERAVGHFNVEEQYIKMKGLFIAINGIVFIVGMGTLLAGAIGVSNIMLVIIKEKTKEIGIQRAIGASPGKIIGQILMESVVITTIPGLLGLSFGVFVLEMVNIAMFSPPPEDAMFLAPEIGFTTGVLAIAILVIFGTLAGLIPANRAVRIRPIDALRDE